jgi:alkanesulfonate monooxygenase SsuD/methylene tetrahydromethanopterin reductase-like flavin-dependent oxidoreductase (luciferase family)
VQLDIFCELERAEPRWSREGEAALIADSLAQAKLADELGYGCWWTVEHHGCGEFSLSSTPELFNVLVSQHTSRIRIGHSGVLAPFPINHPIRVAERSAFLDIVSGGRLEMGCARSGFGEVRNYQLDVDLMRPQLRELFQMLPRMWNEEDFSWKSDLLEIPEINVVPKPLQRPHPPLWQMCISRESFEMAGSLGVGAIGTTLLEPIESLAALRDVYLQGLQTKDNHVSDVVNDQFGIFTFVHCAESREAAIRNGAGEAVLWYINAVPRAFRTPRRVMIDSFRNRYSPGGALAALNAGEVVDDEAWDPDDPVPVIRLLNRQLLGLPLDPEEVYEVLAPMDAVIVGDPDVCRDKMQRFADIGVQRLLCFQQLGGLAQPAVLDSMTRLAKDVMPLL